MPPRMPPIEIEAKFIADAAAVDDLLGQAELGPGCRLGPARGTLSLDVYLDTPERALLAAGFSLRIRQTGEGTWVTLKGKTRSDGGSVHRRVEIEARADAAVAGRGLEDWPEPLRDALVPMVGHAAEWTAVAVVCQFRQVRLVHRAAEGGDGAISRGPVLAELSLDQVMACAPAAAGSPIAVGSTAAKAPAGVPRVLGTWTEVELELKPAAMHGHGVSDSTDDARSDPTDDEAMFRAVVANLARVPGLAPSTASKLERVMALMADDRARDRDGSPAA